MKFNKFIQHKRVVGIPAQNLVGAKKLGGNKGFEYTVKAYDEKGEIAWGHQIRSYVLQPYSLVKDLRTDKETGNTQAVLDGEIDEFMETYLKWRMAKVH